MPKIFIGIPCGELSRYGMFWNSFQALDLAGLDVMIPQQVWSPYIANNQNILARLMRSSDADYFWLLNDDLVFPRQTLKQLLAHQKDIVIPLVMSHELPCEPLFYAHRTGDDYFHRYIKNGERGLVKGIGAGGGGMLISRKVFDAFPDPWWETHFTVASGNGLPIETTEDLDFCQKAKAAGFDIWCDLDTPVGHITLFNVWPVRKPDGTWTVQLERNGKVVEMPMVELELPPELKELQPA